MLDCARGAVGYSCKTLCCVWSATWGAVVYGAVRPRDEKEHHNPARRCSSVRRRRHRGITVMPPPHVAKAHQFQYPDDETNACPLDRHMRYRYGLLAGMLQQRGYR